MLWTYRYAAGFATKQRCVRVLCRPTLCTGNVCSQEDSSINKLILESLDEKNPVSPEYDLAIVGRYLITNVKKLQFIHTVNGDGSKTAKIIKRQC